MTSTALLKVSLNDTFVGILTHLASDRILFSFDESYIENSNRPVLSQSFYTTLKQLITTVKPTQRQAPPFFANLLPEGHLRQYLADKAKINPTRDFGLLELLGHDLPGAVIIEPIDVHKSNKTHKKTNDKKNNVLKFSLAGIQLKFSALATATGGLTIPAHGIGGNWIVKLPSFQFKQVPENEYSMLTLAKNIGIETPNLKLVKLSEISDLPSVTDNLTKKALAIERFDRAHNQRIHIEDFAQVYGIYPDKKYQGVNYNNIFKQLLIKMGESIALQFFERLIFNILIGNGDMHLKNWSFIYLDGKNPTLAPAYDYVATQIFIEDDQLALNFSGEKNISKINKNTLLKFARKVNVSEQLIYESTEKIVTSTITAWRQLKTGLPLNQTTRSKFEKNLLSHAKNILKKSI